MSADHSGGRARFSFRHRPYVPGSDSDALRPGDYDSRAYAGWGPLRWYAQDGSKPADGYAWRTLHVGVSHWLVALPLLVPPALWLKRFRAARRARRAGACPRCGYDLRATPTRCPECGRKTGIRRRCPSRYSASGHHRRPASRTIRRGHE